MSGESLDSLASCRWFPELVRFRPQRFSLDQARATRAFDLRMRLAGVEARPVQFFADPVACCQAAYDMALTEMIDRAPTYARAAAHDARREVMAGRSGSEGRAVAAANKAVNRDVFVDARFRSLGPPYHVVSDDRGISARLRWRYGDRAVDVDASAYDAIRERAERLAQRLRRASNEAFATVRQTLSAGLPDEPNAAWRRMWDAGWWEAWDGPSAAEARQASEDGRFLASEERAAETGAVACEEACRTAWQSATVFAYTAMVRSPEFARPTAVEMVVSTVLERRAGIDLDDDDIAFAATFVEPCLAGVFLSFTTPLAILWAPWP